MKNALIEPLEARIAPAVLIGITGPSPVSEGAGGGGMDTTVSFTVTLSEAAAEQVTVSGNTVAESATEGTDYDGYHQQITFDPGETSKVVTVTIHNDTQHENDETFRLDLS